jgi:hypothetical protein
MKKSPRKKPGEKHIVFQEVHSLEDLARDFQTPVIVQYTINGEGRRLVGVRLNPKQALEVTALLNSALPPRTRTAEGAETYDMLSPEYVREKEKARIRARAVAVYWGFKQFHKAEAKAMSHEEITDWIQGLAVEDDVLELCFSKLTGGRVGLADLVNFTSSSNSPKN